MAHSIIYKKEKRILENRHWKLKSIEWHNHYQRGNLIACSLNIEKPPFRRKCWIYLHVPEHVSGETLAVSQVSIEPLLLGSTRAFNFYPGEIEITSYGIDRRQAIIKLCNLDYEGSSYLIDVDIKVIIPSTDLAKEFEYVLAFIDEYQI